MPLTTSLCLLALPFGLLSDGQALSPAFDPPPVIVGDSVFHRRTLANGLQALVVTESASGIGTASVFMVVGVGTGREGPATSGLAHLVEHTMFTGTEKWGADEHERQLVAWGAESNAFTREDYTLYYDHGFIASHLTQVLSMEALRLRGLTFDRDAFLHERYRLEHEEAATFTQADARGELLDSAVFRTGGYGTGVRDAKGNTMAVGLSIEDVRAFYDRWYHPMHTSVVVAGDVDPDQTLDAIEVAFGGLPPGPPTPPLSIEPEAARGSSFRFASSLPADKLYHAWIGPARLGEGRIFGEEALDRLALTMLADVIVERHRDATGAAVDVSMGGRLERDMFLIGSGGEGALARLDRLYLELTNELPTETELVQARKRLRRRFLSIPVRGRPYFSLAATLGIHAVAGRVEFPAQWPGLLENVRVPEVASAVKRWLIADRRIDVTFVQRAGTDGALESVERRLSDDPEVLADFAQDASEVGDLAGAIAAYEKLLTLGPSRMNSVIYGYYLGGLKRETGDLVGALDALNAALLVVDYPDVRNLADEIRAEIEGREAARNVLPRSLSASQPTADSKLPTKQASVRCTVLTGGDSVPDFAAGAELVMADLEDWRALDFHEDLVVEFLSKQAAHSEKLNGWYSLDTKRLVVIESDNQVMGRGTMLHEMFHALQDQNFDLSALDAAALDTAQPDDALRALRAIVEGEAMLAVADLMDYDFEQHTRLPEDGELDEARFEKVFQYGAGLGFVRALRHAGGWSQVDAALRNPPRSTASILHPDRYLAGVEAEDLGGLPQPECACGEEDPQSRALGEYGLALFLARDVGTRPRSAALAARLSGDRCYSIHDDESGADRFAWYLAFYDTLAAEEFSQLAAQALGLEVWSLDNSGKRVGVFLDRDPLPSK